MPEETTEPAGNGPEKRVGIVGCGRIAGMEDHPGNPHITTHARAIHAHAGYRLAACCDPDPARAEAFARRWGGQAFTNLGNLLDRGGVDVVVIAASTPAHSPLLNLLFDRDGDETVICEKPLVESRLEWESLKPKLKAAARPWAVNFPRRYDAAHRALRDRLHTGELGPLLSFHAHVAKGLMHNGSHMVDLLLFLLGDIVSLEPVALRPLGHGDLSGTALVTLASGQTGTLTGVDGPDYSLFELDLVYQRGKVEIRQIGHELTLLRGVPSLVHPGFFDLSARESLAPTYHEAFLGIYRSLAEPGFREAGHGAQAIRGMDLLMGLAAAAENARKT